MSCALHEDSQGTDVQVHILTLSHRSRWVVSFALLPLRSGKEVRYTLKWKRDEPHCMLTRKSPPDGIETPVHPSVSLATVPSTLLRTPHKKKPSVLTEVVGKTHVILLKIVLGVCNIKYGTWIKGHTEDATLVLRQPNNGFKVCRSSGISIMWQISRTTV